MKTLSRWSGAAAIVLGAFALGTWNLGASSAVTPVAPDGELLFATKGCAVCHVGPDSNTLMTGFPPLDDAPNWAADRRPGIDAEQYLAESIVAPDAFTSPLFRPGQRGPTSAMPRLRVTAQEVTALVDYLLDDDLLDDDPLDQ